MKAQARREMLPNARRAAKSGRATPEKTSGKRIAPRKSPPNDYFPIAGIGASAGGLEAFTQLLKHLPVDTGMGFVLVQHLDPQHESALTQLLARATTMPVLEVTNNLRVAANHVYVIPPNTNLAIASGVLKLGPRPKGHAPHHSIDFFLEALAHDQKDGAIGVILSGTATDGTLGLEAIKAESGITFAQDESAKYDSMPRNAIAAGCVDFVLSPPKIAQELARIAQHPYVRGGVWAGALSAGGQTVSAERTRSLGEARALPEEGKFTKMLLLLRSHCGVDFSLYKPSTIQRRITRRMVLNKQNTPAAYADFLRHNPKELDALYSDALISVTSFFRNPEAFEAIEGKVFPKLIARAERDNPLRVWVPGCSSGQEAYSIAISFAEFSETVERAPKLQIFATDLNEALLDKARRGIYPKTLAQEISPERLRRFFVEDEGGYRVIKLLRQQVIFARQNLISDPPFSRLDLISCRNLLIYLEADLQRRIIPAFHYALKPGGFLFLGASESVGQFPELFAAADKKQKIFLKKAGPTPAFRLPLPNERAVDPVSGSRLPMPSFVLAEGGRGEGDAQREADRIMVSQFGPPGVLINAELQILQFRGVTGAFLEPATGKASFDLLKMARPSLMLPLRAAINKAMRENKPVRRENVRMAQNGATRILNLQVIPLKNLKEPCYLVLFEAARVAVEQKFVLAKEPKRAREAHALPREGRRVADLEHELSETRDYLQSLQEQHEAANEELQASSEEVQSANEELQSINEELETSKEELESANEELTTVNEEMTGRNAELSRLNADLNNLQVSIHTAILLFSRELILRRFTPVAGKLFNLLPSDLGRPLGNIRHNLEVPDLERLLAEVIETVTAREREVRDRDGHWYALRARPYLLDNQIDGVVLVLGDIDALKRSEEEIRAARDYAEATLRTIPGPLVVLHADLRVSTANDAFYKIFQVMPAATEGRLIYEVGNGQWDIPRLRQLLEEIIPQKEAISGFEVTHEFEIIGRRSMLLNARRVDGEDGVPARILLAIEDITLRRRVEQQVIHSQKMEGLGTLAGGIAHDFNNILAIILGYATRLEKRKARPEQFPEAIKVIRDAVERGASLVQQLLTSARQSETHLTALDLNALVRELGGMLGATFPKTIKFILRPEPNLPLVKADRSQIHQVLLNLCVNARDAMPKGGKITLQTGLRAGPQLREYFSGATAARYVLLRVIDTGTGISREVEPHIFEPFYSTKERRKGTGLGLSVVYGVVNNHQGFVRVGSDQGRGTTFSVYLPLEPESAPTAAPGAPRLALPNDAARTILFVEDEEMLRALGAMVLQDDGYRVLEARDGFEAVEVFEAHHAEIGLVICDLGLPRLGGREVFLKIKERKPNVRAIIATGYLEPDMRSEMIGAGVIDVIEKPYDFHTLLEKVRALLGPPKNREP